MRIAIIGGGFTGLTAAYELTKAGHTVTLFEKDKELGGLAAGFKEKNWDWYLEKTYHHWFTNDEAIIGLARELGLNDKLIIKRPVTANFWHGVAYPFDNPLNLLHYPGLTTIDKLRTAVLVAFCKLNPFWQPLEGISAEKLAVILGGRHAWQALWQPLMSAKFGDYADQVAASWLWARIKKRTPNLGYIEGGFHALVESLNQKIKQQGGTIRTNTSVSEIKNLGNHQLSINHSLFDRVLLTVPTAIALKLVPQLTTIPHLHAQTLILKTKEPILDKVYWLSVLDRNFPFLAVVAHTNFMDPKHYGGANLTYFGNYLPEGHPYLSLTKEKLLKKFLPFIRRLTTHDLQPTILNSYLFTAPFAQPVHLLHYSELAPKLGTDIPGLYLANLDSIYPWDRGTNYAVELGQKAAKFIEKEAK